LLSKSPGRICGTVELDELKAAVTSESKFSVSAVAFATELKAKILKKVQNNIFMYLYPL
jgi:hypothetical protein